jgi:hypothetical protein
MRYGTSIETVASRMDAEMRLLFPDTNTVAVHSNTDRRPECMLVSPRLPEFASKLFLTVPEWNHNTARTSDIFQEVVGK